MGMEQFRRDVIKDAKMHGLRKTTGIVIGCVRVVVTARQPRNRC